MSIDECMFKLIERLQKIAKLNDDEFLYRIDVELLRGGKLKYCFVAEETADGHEFASGCGGSIQEAIAETEDGIPAACEYWEYKEM